MQVSVAVFRFLIQAADYLPWHIHLSTSHFELEICAHISCPKPVTMRSWCYGHITLSVWWLSLILLGRTWCVVWCSTGHWNVIWRLWWSTLCLCGETGDLYHGDLCESHLKLSSGHMWWFSTMLNWYARDTIWSVQVTIPWALFVYMFGNSCMLLIRTSGDMQVPDDKLKSLRHTLEPFLKKNSIVLSSHMRPLRFCSHTKSSNSLPELPLLIVKDAVILCVSAVGCPESLDLVLLQVLYNIHNFSLWMLNRIGCLILSQEVGRE